MMRITTASSSCTRLPVQRPSQLGDHAESLKVWSLNNVARSPNKNTKVVSMSLKDSTLKKHSWYYYGLVYALNLEILVWSGMSGGVHQPEDMS